MDIDPTGIFVATALSAAAFAFLGNRIRQNGWGWAILGALIGNVVFTITIGIAHSVAVPYTSDELSRCYVYGYVVGAVILALVAGGMFFRARRQTAVPRTQAY